MKFRTRSEVIELIKASGLDPDAVFMIIDEALDEDLGGRGVLPAGTGHRVDVTSEATIAADARATARLVARSAGVRHGKSRRNFPSRNCLAAATCSAVGRSGTGGSLTVEARTGVMGATVVLMGLVG